ncbi:DUF397 domain-containing protein [Streptomyces sp. NPDC051567]|uniref:DUF397 domain-containing protein n=1 Tax=Streptomyces sp. NPDC051567 TaxID=3365660 RepID=UPI0037B20398
MSAPSSHQWIKSSYSTAAGDNCLEWSPTCAAATGTVPVRDSKLTDGPVLTVSPTAWTAFIGTVRADG